MNPSSQTETDTLRSDIDKTRRRMDDTMDALGDRFQPRHLVDEFLGFMRQDMDEGGNRLGHLREKVVHSCDTAMHAVVDGVKKNPIPVLVIGAGVVWMLSENRREKARRYEFEEYRRNRGDFDRDPDRYYDRPLEYPAPTTGESELRAEGASKFEDVKDQVAEKASSAAEKVKDKVSEAGEAAREKVGALRERAGEVSSHLRHEARDALVRTRERVADTAEHHPLEVGLIALAAGLIAGLALPTPNAVNRTVGPAADKLRARARQAGDEILDKGRRVAEAAVDAAKSEAQAQGLTLDRLHSQVEKVAEGSTEAASAAAGGEGLKPSSQTTPAAQSDPSSARPAV
jgi:ElaB/YqjD/DUF883 family membrane-anchored ribosome-binding protein